MQNINCPELFKLTHDQKGFSLIEVMIVSSIILVLMMGFFTVINNIQGEARAISQKMTVVDLQSQLSSFTNIPEYCDCSFKDLTANMDATPPTLNSTSVNRIPKGFTNDGVDPCIASTEDLVPPSGVAILGTTVTIESTNLKNINFVNNGVFTADLEVNFSSQGLVRPLKPIQKMIVLSFDLTGGTSAARPFEQCRNLNSTNSQLPQGDYIYLSYRGGGGGGPFSLQCPNGKLPIGIQGRSGAEMDALGLLCPQNYETVVVGGGGGGPFTMNCPAGKVLHGFRGRSGALVDGIQPICQNIE